MPTHTTEQKNKKLGLLPVYPGNRFRHEPYRTCAFSRRGSLFVLWRCTRVQGNEERKQKIPIADLRSSRRKSKLLFFAFCILGYCVWLFLTSRRVAVGNVKIYMPSFYSKDSSYVRAYCRNGGYWVMHGLVAVLGRGID